MPAPAGVQHDGGAPIIDGLTDRVTNGITNGITNEFTNGITNGITNGLPTTNGTSSPSALEHSVTDAFHADSHSPPEPIAICGMACRLPGGLSSPEQAWQFICNKMDGRIKVPSSRYSVDSYYNPGSAKPATVSTQYGYFLDESVDLGALDTSFFTLPRTEVERADPQQRLMLEVARECFEDAGVTNWRGKTIGCYIGNFGEDWIEMYAKENQQWGLHRIVGTGDFVISNRLSYEFDINGPSMTIRTGCSAALVALNEACAALGRGDCEAALVGGVNLIMGPGMTTAMTEQGILSKDGASKSFSAEANGYARGEAVTAIYVKPLAAALRDGNPIRAIVKATSHNSDGRTPGLSQPSTDSQEALMRRAYALAGISDFGETAMVECHGTGTQIGDPIEAKAVARVFGEKGVFIGSVKPNLGHTEAASGLVSLIKMVKALEHRTIPPNIKFATPNPNIPFEEAKMVVPLEPTPWPEDRLERISLNSFGVGGANAHVILESAAHHNIYPRVSEPSDAPQLLLFSANTKSSLERMIAQYKDWVDKSPDGVTDLAYTLARRREHLRHRAFAICQHGAFESVSAATDAKAASTAASNVVMVFTGQGAQWPQMGRDLLQSNEVFRSTIRSLDQYLEGIANYSIEKELKKPAKTSKLSSAELSQPLCTALQLGLVDVFKAVGIVPSAVVGHSSGEIAGAYAAGALTAQEAITAAHYRGAVTIQQTKPGCMAAIGMGWNETEKYLVPNVRVACDNSPLSVTISGDTESVEKAVASIQEQKPDVMARLLKVDKAYHSHHMAEVGDAYVSLMGDSVRGGTPSIPFFSSVEGKLANAGTTFGPQYWRTNLESPVRFREAVSAILSDEKYKNAVFLEVGPHSALAGPLRQIFSHASSPAPYVSAMLRAQDCTSSFLAAVGKLFSLRVSVDLEALFPAGSCLPDLPRYPWNHEESYWYESRLSKEWRLRKFPLHDLLGLKTAESSELEPVYRNLLHLSNVPWVRDHRLGEDTVFPFAGYLAIAGEAARQITGIENGYSVRNIIVSTALVVTEGKPTEMISTFKPHRLTSSLNSSWWEFTVSSYNGHAWVKHCVGEVSAMAGQPSPAAEVPSLPRKINAKKYYETMQKGGLDLGPSFQTIEAIETSTGHENRAVGKVSNGKQGDEANYHIHPVTLDATIQIMGAGATNGSLRKTRTWLPTSIDSFTVWRCAAAMQNNITATLSSNQSVVGSGICVSEGKAVVEATGVKLALADGTLGAAGFGDTHAAARYEWAPDVAFKDFSDFSSPRSDNTDVLSRLDELGQLCLLLSKRRIANLDTPIGQPHLEKYASWISSQAHSVVVSLAPNYKSLDNETIVARIDSLVAQLAGTKAGPVARAIQQICSNTEILLSNATLRDLLSEEDLAGVQKFVQQSHPTEFIRCLSHSKPNLRVMELSTGGTPKPSEEIVEAIKHVNGQVLCSNYTVTSTSFITAKDQEKSFPNLEVKTLDIRDDPEQQGFDGAQFDLIVASNALRASTNVQQSLGYLKKLLKADGYLLLQEHCSSARWVTYVFGLQPEWWSETPEANGEGTPLNAADWKTQLAAAGLGRISSSSDDSPSSDPLTVTLVARHASIEFQKIPKLTVLCDEKAGHNTEVIISHLEKTGHQVTRCSLEDQVPAGQNVLSLLDADKAFFADMTEARYLALKTFLTGVKEAGVLWVTKSCEVGCIGPQYALIIGLARVLRSEQMVNMATIQIDDLQQQSSLKQLSRVIATFQDQSGDDELNPDFEWAIQDGEVLVGRFQPFTLLDQLLEDEPSSWAKLDVATPGRINSLHWVQQPREELAPGEVEVQVHAAGLNFRDILVALGIVELPIRQFGLEAGGIITRVASDVDPNELKVGDRVFCLKKQAYSTYLTTPTTFCVRIPDHLSFEDAGSMLMPYVTALHSLVNVAHLEKGQSVLIHSACGGVGLAAVQVCQMIGAELYVTVGNEEKVNFLMDNFKIPRNRIFDSRSASFVDGVKRETDGKGIDVILNSLSGELLHATWTCVAEFGTLVEIGKRDLIGHGKLDMNPFLANRSYSCVDIDQLWKKPQLLRRLILNTLDYYVQGLTTPVRPNKVFPASQTQDAFRYMQKGQHIGRVCISIPHKPWPSRETAEMETSRTTGTIAFGSQASYLMVGGLGGLGRAIAAWMAEHGAGEMIFLSRSAGTTNKNDDFVAELESMNCGVKLVAGDVTQAQDVQRALATASYPVKGVVQMSMVLRDQNFSKMNFEDWNAVVAPKVQGTWALHEATQSVEADLDFFVLFSSLSGVIGQPGQANYAAANTFLDAFAQWRNQQSLPASVIDIGAVEEVGYISEQQGMIGSMKATGFKGISEQELLDAMTVAMLRQPGGGSPPKISASNAGKFSSPTAFVLGLGSSIPLTSSSNRAVWKRDRRMAAYHNVQQDGASASSSAETLKSYLAQVKSDASLLKTAEAANLLAVEIGKKLFDMLLKPYDEMNTSLPLTDLGLDSLVALELRAWWKQVFGFDITVLEMLGMGSLVALGQHAADSLFKLMAETAGAASASASA
ncbi:polyketide synthase [Lecanosticta acicola]|uniref:Polyketide synthase n=1 Tax=Lecanosticta acicola TaxID=111012 RepID=A0AAI8YSI5_9PEZI|nr:polyketide synthase [Lecanosticta acicola]